MKIRVIVNYALGNSIKLKEFVLIEKKLLNSNSKINFGIIKYRENQVMHMKPNISKLTNLLNWYPNNSYENGLEKF